MDAGTIRLSRRITSFSIIRGRDPDGSFTACPRRDRGTFIAEQLVGLGVGTVMSVGAFRCCGKMLVFSLRDSSVKHPGILPSS